MNTAQPDGPAVPTPGARVQQRPLGVRDVELTSGPLADWQRTGRDVTLPLAATRLEEAGNLHNLRLAAGELDPGAGDAGEGGYRGPRFMDSDLHKGLEAIGWEAARGDGSLPAELAAFVAEAVGLLERAQLPDGYLNSHYQVVEPEKRYTFLAHSHELYCAGHLFQAAVAHARAGSAESERLLAVACRFADHLVAAFGGDEFPGDGMDGHPEVETALVELSRLTGKSAYLGLARTILERRGHDTFTDNGMGRHYLQDHLPVREAPTPIGHAVRQLYLDAGAVDLAVELGDDELLAASVRRWEAMVAGKTSITGGVGSRHDGEAFGDDGELTPDQAYNETCAAIASIQWSWRLLLATGEARYADLIERTLYNGFASGTSADGGRFFYVNPLQRRADHLQGEDTGRRHAWFSCACCPPNIMRLIASLGGYVATTSNASSGSGSGSASGEGEGSASGEGSGGALTVQQYAGGRIRATLPAGDVELEVETDYPWSTEVRLVVRRTPDGPWELGLRIPAWSSTAQLSLATEGRRADEPARVVEPGYATVLRTWRVGDEVRLRLDDAVRLTRPHRRLDALRGCVALERGPLVYCLEAVDQAPGVELDDLVVPADAPLRAIRRELSGIGSTVVVEAEGYAVSEPRDGLPYSAATPPATSLRRPTTLVAIPYFQWDNREPGAERGGAMRVWLPTT